MTGYTSVPINRVTVVVCVTASKNSLDVTRIVAHAIFQCTDLNLFLHLVSSHLVAVKLYDMYVQHIYSTMNFYIRLHVTTMHENVKRSS